MAGYKFEKVPGHGKLLVRDEPIASILQEALEGYASGRFSCFSEVKAFLDATPAWPKPPGGQVHTQSLEYIFPRVIYAGYIDLPDWGVSLVKGKHAPLISFATWQKIIERIEGNSHAPARADLHEDFPLRGFVTCGCCGNKLTAAWSKGRSKLYAYYVCQTRGCAEKGKSIRKETMESAFGALLRRLRPAPELFKVATDMLRNLWDARLTQAEQGTAHVAREIAAIEAKTGQLVERLVATESPALISAYEAQIVKLEEQKTALIDREVSAGRPPISFETVSRTALTFLANPWKLWTSGSFQHQRAVLKLAFTAPLPYDRNTGYRTADLSLPFRLLQDLRDGNLRMVGGTGIEPVTPTV
ncbi:MAG: zinc ribbon domain-containing protein [Pseudomonadota bacterium]